MFSITAENSFKITGRDGITLIGKTSLTGSLKVGDFLADSSDHTECYKITGIESVRFSDLAKNLTHNPAIMIKTDKEPSYFNGKTLVSVSDTSV